MIRYNTSPADIVDRVNTAVPGWRDRAQARTNHFLAVGKFDEPASSHIWSEVKPVFIAIQRNKCAYCERRLDSPDDGGTIAHDLEHFRPKASVDPWPGDSVVGFSTGRASATGYYWLAYDLENYLVSCKKCNTPSKGNSFPIAGRRGKAGQTSSSLAASERHDLVYPLGTADEDPARIVTFLGMVAKPVGRKSNGARWRRAKVIIEFFKLNAREELRTERARLVVALYPLLVAANDPASAQPLRDDSQFAIDELTQESSPHSACTKAFVALFKRRPAAARRQKDICQMYLVDLRT